MAIIQRAAGLAMGFLEVFLLKFYQWIVDTAPAGSWPVRLFTYLATGPFRCTLTWRSPCGAHLYDVGEFEWTSTGNVGTPNDAVLQLVV